MKSLFASLILSTFSFADSFSYMPYLNLNLSKAKFDYFENDFYNFETTEKMGYGLGVALEVNLVPKYLNLRTALEYSQLRSKEDRPNSIDTHIYHNLSIPLMALTQTAPFYMGIGVQVNYMLSAKIEAEFKKYDDEIPDYDLRKNGFFGDNNFSIPIMVGIDLMDVGQGTWNFEFFYNLPIGNGAPTLNEDYFDNDITSYGIRLGLVFGL